MCEYCDICKEMPLQNMVEINYLAINPLLFFSVIFVVVGASANGTNSGSCLAPTPF